MCRAREREREREEEEEGKEDVHHAFSDTRLEDMLVVRLRNLKVVLFFPR